MPGSQIQHQVEVLAPVAEGLGEVHRISDFHDPHYEFSKVTLEMYEVGLNEIEPVQFR